MIARMTIQECGMSDAVLETLARDIERAPDDIKVHTTFIQSHVTFAFDPFGIFLFQLIVSFLKN
mgnify:CR=1 FL=1|jgi:hypothetical protein